MLKTIKKLFEKKEEKIQRQEKELLRENLSLVPVDIFYIDDPILSIPEDKRVLYYKKFHDLCADKDIMERIKYLINKQARLTLQSSITGISDALGSGSINGMASVKDDFERMGSSYLKETAPTTDFNRYNVI